MLGAGISPLTKGKAVYQIVHAIETRSSAYVCVAAAHSVMAYWLDDLLRRIFNRSMMTKPDWMPLVGQARAATRHLVERAYGLNLLLLSQVMGQKSFELED